MENGPSTPAQTSASNLNDFGGPGLFSAEKNARAEMDKSAMKERPGSDQSSEKYSMEDIQGEQKRSSGRGSSESSRTLESGDTAKLAAVTPSSASHTMAPPPKPNFKSTPTSAQQPRPAETESNQDSPAQTADESRSGGSRIPTSSKHEKATMRTTNGKRRLGEIDQHQPRNDDSDVKPFNDHAKSLDAFDWMDLETRYHHQMDDFGRQEQEIYRSFEDLCNVR